MVKEKSMESEEEDIQLLSIKEEAFNILLFSSHHGLVCTLAFTLLLPLSFETLVLCQMPDPLVLYISNHKLFYMITKSVKSVTLKSRVYEQLWTVNVVFQFWMLSILVVMYMADSIYMANDISLENTLTFITRFWKPLAVTLF